MPVIPFTVSFTTEKNRTAADSLDPMCLILLAYRQHPEASLIILANRDEFYSRPTAVAQFWPQAPDLLAGRDLLAGGTWLGINRTGRFAAVTNFRDPNQRVSTTRSRGALVSDFLLGEDDIGQFLDRVHDQRANYQDFNLLLGDQESIWCYSSRLGETKAIEPGVHALSNEHLNSPWPKVTRGCRALDGALRNSSLDEQALLSILADRTAAADHELPNTGLDVSTERMLSPIFIASDTYGTRSSTLLSVSSSGEVSFVERSFSNLNGELDTQRFSFALAVND